MLLFLALTACVTPDPTEIPVDAVRVEGFAMAAPASDLPAGAAIVNMGCFGSGETEWQVGAASPAPAPPVQPAPSVAQSGGSRAANDAVTTGTASTKAPKPAKEASSQDRPASAPSPDLAPAPPEEAVASDRDAKAAKKEKSVAFADDEESGAEFREELAGPTGASFDWGATVYLSNDDSMSLASAQRVLWAVLHDKPIQSREVRPHELLNYFSFDTAPVAQGKLFSVVPSAEKTGAETLTVALAVKGATPPRKPLDLTVVVDRSGSMRAEGRMDYTKKGLALMSGNLKRGDRVDVVLFDNEVCTPLENYIVGRDDPTLLTSVINAMQPRGATNIGVGLKEAYRITAQADRDQGSRRNRRVMLVTDALVNQGQIDADVLAQIGRAYEEKGVRVTGVGVGNEFDDTVLDKITETGKGAYVYLGSEAVVERVFGAAGFDSLVQTIAHDVHFSIDLPPSLAMERFYGEEASTDKADVQPIHYYAGTTQLFLQDLKVDPKKLAPGEKVTLKIEYREAATGEPATQSFSWTVGELLEADRHNLDKGRALMAWTDMLQARSMGADPCAGPSGIYAERASQVEGDAEIAYVTSLAAKWCAIEVPEAVTTVAYKVRVDADVPIAEVVLARGGDEAKQRIGGSDTIARFDVARPGTCSLTLQGATPMVTSVNVPSTGGDVRCTVRGGRISCT